MKKPERPVYTFDIETDPFDGESNIQPFACGLYTGNIGKGYYETWCDVFDQDDNDNCIRKMKRILDTLPPGIVYAHNGGKFDMFYCMDWFTTNKKMMIVNERIVMGHIWIKDSDEYHEFRDSMAIMPYSLKKTGEKEYVDYRTFTVKYRVKHKKTILSYLKQDCVLLHKRVTAFIDMFGHNYTIGSTAMKQLKKLHKFECLDRKQDALIRGDIKHNIPGYYYGGRVECFEAGVIKATKGERIIAYDINQCYPNVMRNMLHPISVPDTIISNEIKPNTYFVTVHGRNHGAFPVRTRDGLRFNVDKGTFYVSIHEYRAAIESGMFECDDILGCINFSHASTFDKFVDKFHGLRKDAQQKGDDIAALFYKYVGNSCYGKFAQNPDNYNDYMFSDMYMDKHTIQDNLTKSDRYSGWYPCTVSLLHGYILWKKESSNDSRYNVATGASITGGARSILIRALANAKRPLYCDTDSIICEGLNNVPIHPHELGHWKIEKTGDRIAIAGRKMYAMFDGKECVKDACKGAVLSPEQIVSVANGAVIPWHKDSPTYDFKTHTMRYLSREIRRTV